MWVQNRRLNKTPSGISSYIVRNFSPYNSYFLVVARFLFFADHNIRLTDHDLREMNISSVPLGTGGYQGMLGVMHELHCLVCNS